MPTFNYQCEICESRGRAWRKNKPPRFCSRKCQGIGHSLSRSGKSWSKIIINEFQAQMIRRAYAGKTGNGEINDLAHRLGLPRWKISRFAIKEGLIAVQKKEPDWSETELKILENNAHCCANIIKQKLRKAGFKRTELGIVLKRKRCNFLHGLKGQSALSLALCFGVDGKTITRYIEKGYLKTKKRGTKRTPQQGGDQWFIKDAAIRKFVRTYPEYVDFGKVDKIWLIALLAGN